MHDGVNASNNFTHIGDFVEMKRTFLSHLDDAQTNVVGADGSFDQKDY